MIDYQSNLEFSVRDYECDLAGMVNNASYLNYLEHARHQFLKGRGIDFAQLGPGWHLSGGPAHRNGLSLFAAQW